MPCPSHHPRAAARRHWIARLSAITSRAYLADARRAHAEAGTPPWTTRPGMLTPRRTR
jgi:hypothetical protein